MSCTHVMDYIAYRWWWSNGNIYGVTMFVWLQCCDYHGIPLFHDDSICLNVFIDKMINIGCGT